MTNYIPNITPSEGQRRDVNYANATVVRGGVRQEIKVNGRQHSQFISDRCKTCALPPNVIRDIHARSISGITAAQIARDLEEQYGDDPEMDLPKYQALLNHLKFHFSGTKDGKSLDEQIMSVMAMSMQDVMDNPILRVSPEAGARLVLQAAAAKLAQGGLEVKASDMLSAAKLVRDIEKEDSDVDQAIFFAEALTIVMDEVQKALPAQDFSALIWKLQANPAMQDILRKARGEDEEPEYIEATVVPPRELTREESLMSVIE